jgi:hypothetical protein
MAHSHPSLRPKRAFVVQVRAPPPGTAAAYDARGEQVVSGQVARCHPCGIPMSFPRMGLSGVAKPFHTRAI